MKNVKFLLVVFVALSLFACSRKSRLTGDTGASQVPTSQPTVSVEEFLSQISGTWLIDIEPTEEKIDGIEVSQLDITNHKKAYPFKYEFKDGELTLSSLDENVPDLPSFKLVNSEQNRAYFHTEVDVRAAPMSGYYSTLYKKYYKIIDLTLDTSESVPHYIVTHNIERVTNEDISSFAVFSYKVLLTEKVEGIPYHAVTEKDLSGKEFELKLSKPGPELGQEIVTKLFMKISDNFTEVRDALSTEYTNTVYGKNIIDTDYLVFTDMKPKFVMDMNIFTEDSRYEFLGYFFLEDGKIVMRGKYRIQNIRIKEWDKSKHVFYSNTVGGDWELDSFEPVREEGLFEAVEVAPIPSTEEEKKE